MNDMSFRNWQTPRPQRHLREAICRGLKGRCPACGRGRLFRAYLKLNRACAICGEDLTHARADDAPAYLTLLIVCHVVGAGVLFTDETWPHTPLLVTAAFWLVFAIVMSLLLLQPFKGAVVGQQWALGMHGFGRDAV